MHRNFRVLTLLTVLLSACATTPSAVELAGEETGSFEAFDRGEEALTDPSDVVGPAVVADAATEVWAVRNQWADTDTAEARLAGLAWTANSGLNWEQKFDRWVSSFETIGNGGSRTFRIKTPFGDRSLEAPTLECAEVALFLRSTFAAWHGLPFFMVGWDSALRAPIYAGNFGFVTRDGLRWGNFPNFRTQYRDYTSTWRAGQPWPSDTRLRGMRLGDDDRVGFLSTDSTVAGAGAYFDEMHLNKRVGYFQRLLLLYFGSINLVDGQNTFHAAAASLEPGDMLIERWQRRGIGHVMPIFRRVDSADGRFEVSVAYGSMPRQQPSWRDGAASRHYFLLDEVGGPGSNSDGHSYASLGGGLRRWRTAYQARGRWRNSVMESEHPNFIGDNDLEAIAGRIAQFEMLLGNVSPEQRRDLAIQRIQAARMHLEGHPASCSARANREGAFDELYAVMAENFGESRSSVDRQYRTLADYVFAPLEYAASRTCCWNTTTTAMREIIMAYAEREQADAQSNGMCVEPTVFRSEAADRMAGGDGYARWRTFAASINRSADWRAWSEDEMCQGTPALGDTTRAPSTGATTFCSLNPATPASCDGGRSNNTFSTASAFASSMSGSICAGDVDFVRVTLTRASTIELRFQHRVGDLELELLDSNNRSIASSTTVDSVERVMAPAGTYVLRIFGYNNATGPYTLAIL